MNPASITDCTVVAEMVPEKVAEIDTGRPVTLLTQELIQVILRHRTERMEPSEDV
jgi:hypothetical protein